MRRSAEHAYNLSLKQTHTYNRKSNSFVFSTPPAFSFIHNPSETSDYFKRLLSFITSRRNFGKEIYIDTSRTSELSIDALMYLLAIVNNLNDKFCGKYSFGGNSPLDPDAKKHFDESGFFRYVKRTVPTPLQHSRANVQIVSGTNSDTDVAKQISEFVCNIGHIDKAKCQFLYVMMIELMSNTYKHAYDRFENVLNPHWYCFAEYDNIDTVSFTFMDTGEGIPATVQKNFPEKIDILNLKGDDRYVTSALNGEFRTSTKQPYRGKGLPKIRSFCSEGKIHNLRVVTNSANVSVNGDDFSSEMIIPALKGTLYYWEINLSDLKGECA